MQINRTTDYALRILYYLGSENRVVSSSEMSSNIKISQRYLLSITKNLKKFGYINADLGSIGGYYLAKSLREITLYDVITQMEGTIVISRCLMQEEHCNGHPCILHDIYNLLQNTLECYLNSITIEDLLELPTETWTQTIINRLYEMYRSQIN